MQFPRSEEEGRARQHIMNTFESKVQKRLSEFAADEDDEKVEYLLDLAGCLLSVNSSSSEEETSPPESSLQRILATDGVQRDRKEKLLLHYLADVEQNAEAQMKVFNERSAASSQPPDCKNCGGTEMRFVSAESYYVCLGCGACIQWMSCDTSNMSFVEEVDRNVVQIASYKKSTHFSDLLASLQARTSVDIEAQVLDAVRAELRKDRITDRSKITASRIKQYLKKNNFNKLYRHASAIAIAVSGLPPLHIDPEVENELKRDFAKVEVAFRTIVATSPAKRSNLPSYQYVLKRLAERHGLTELAERCTLLKSRSKLFLVDSFWKEVCRINKWEFTRTI